MSVGVYLSVFAFIFSSTKLPKSLNYIHIVFIIAKHEAGFENTTKHTAHRKEWRKIERERKQQLSAAQRDTENPKLCLQQFIVFYQIIHFTDASMEPCI